MVEGDKEAMEEENPRSLCSSDAEKKKCPFILPVSDEREEEEEKEEPHRQLACLETPDFLLPDAPEGNSGERSNMIVMAYVAVCGFTFKIKCIFVCVT